MHALMRILLCGCAAASSLLSALTRASVLCGHPSLQDVQQWKMVAPAVNDSPSSTGHVYRSVAAVRWALIIKDCGSVDGALRAQIQVCDMGFRMDTFLQI
jgi:hypothetical protein